MDCCKLCFSLLRLYRNSALFNISWKKKPELLGNLNVLHTPITYTTVMPVSLLIQAAAGPFSRLSQRLFVRLSPRGCPSS